MNIEKIEQTVAELKTAFDAYTSKKSFTTRKDVRKALQTIKVAAQEMRTWILEDFK